MKLTADHTIKLSGRYIQPGQQFDVNEAEAKRLIAMKAATSGENIVIVSSQKSSEIQSLIKDILSEVDENSSIPSEEEIIKSALMCLLLQIRKEKADRKNSDLDLDEDNSSLPGSSEEESASIDSSENLDEEVDATGENLPTDGNLEAVEIDAGDSGESDSFIAGISKSTMDLLSKNGYDSIEKLRTATTKDLIKIPKLGYTNAKKIVEAVKAKA